MLSARWYQVINNLWDNRARTMLIVLSIAVGLFAIGTIVSSRAILSREMAASFAAIHPSSGTVRTAQLFDQDFVHSVRDMPGIQDADGRRVISARVQVGEDRWNNITLFAIADYDDMRVNQIRPERGAWPPPDRQILIERAALPVIEKHVGDVILIETPDEKRYHMRIAGTAHDQAQLPAQFDNSPYGYISFETLEWFGEPYGLNELYIIADNPQNSAAAQQRVNEVKEKAEKSGLTIPMSMTAEPGQLPLDDILQAVLLVMGALGLLSLFTSAFLVINTVSALLTQQKRQIGVMKAIGARTRQLLGMYLAMVSCYGLLALILSIPLSVVGSRALARFMAAQFNFDLTSQHVPSQAFLIQLAVGLLVPTLASLYPFLSTLRLSAAEAMRDHGLGQGKFGAGPIDRLLSGTTLWFVRRVLIRPLVLSLRNTFRHKGRLALTLTTLTLASAIFVSVFSLRASLLYTVDELLQMWNFDAWITFSRPYRIERIEQQTAGLPDVTATDVWIQMPTRRVRPDESESETIYLFGPRADSHLAVAPAMVRGRWLLPEDENALVVSTTFLQKEPDIDLGDEIVLKMNGREQPWHVVGVSAGFLIPMVYANYPYLARVTGRVGQADAVLVSTVQHDPAYVNQKTAQIENHLERRGLNVSSIQTTAAERGEATAAYGIIISLLMIMAFLLAVVGGLGLAGTTSINVLERTREIGVLRAIGAPGRGIAQVFVLEGMIVGLLSWLLGTILSLPLSKVLSDAIGEAIAGSPLHFSFSTTGVWLWLGTVILLSAAASFVPARNASQLTVREVLAYE